MKFQVNHDLHCHSTLSACCGDKKQTIRAIYERAVRQGLETQCVTDHLWDRKAPGPSRWYASQDINHVKQGKAELEAIWAQQGDGPRMVFGCETEYCGGQKLGLTRENFDEFDFVIIPPNHFHMINFTRDESINTEEAIAELFTQRLFKIARDQGCKFYIGSDAHSLKSMEGMMEVAREVVDLLELTDEQRYQILQ